MRKVVSGEISNVSGGPFDGMFMTPSSDGEVSSSHYSESGAWHWYRWDNKRERWVFVGSEPSVLKYYRKSTFREEKHAANPMEQARGRAGA